MKRLLAALLLWPTLAFGQTGVPYFPQTLPASTVIGRLSSGAGPTEAITFTQLASALGSLPMIATPGGSANQLQWNNAGVLGGISGAISNGTTVTFATSDLILGGSSTGTTAFASANSGASNFTLTFPAVTDTLAVLGTAQTWSAAQTFINSDLILLGSSTGKTTFTSANAGASNYTVTIQAATDTLVGLATTDTLTNKTLTAPSIVGGTISSTTSVTGAMTFTNSDILLLGSSTGKTTFTSANAGVSNFTITVPAVTGQLAIGAPGQLSATATNDSATAGNVGEWVTAGDNGSTSTVTITNASPGVISWTAHGMNPGSVIFLTTSSALPIGLTASTNYYVCNNVSFTANAFAVATTVANAMAGTCINTSSAGSGTQTGHQLTIGMSTNTTVDAAGVSLTAGDWDVWGNANFTMGATTNATLMQASVGTTSGTFNSVVGAYSSAAVPNAGQVGGNNFVTVGPYRFSLSGTTTVFLDCVSTFTTSTQACYGGIFARRVR